MNTRQILNQATVHCEGEDGTLHATTAQVVVAVSPAPSKPVDHLKIAERSQA